MTTGGKVYDRKKYALGVCFTAMGYATAVAGTLNVLLTFLHGDGTLLDRFCGVTPLLLLTATVSLAGIILLGPGLRAEARETPCRHGF